MSYSFTIEKSNRRSFGCLKSGNSFIFTVSLKSSEYVLFNMYDKDDLEICSIDISGYRISGTVYSFKICFEGEIDSFSYEYVVDGKTVNDPYLTNHTNRRKYAELKSNKNAERALVLSNDYDFLDDVRPDINPADTVAYELHVRGFTKHSSSKVKARGTYKGITEKIGYLKQLGINQLILMPVYEFYEFDSDNTKNYIAKEENTNKSRLNYWGFKTGYYFCPKAGYAYSDDFIKEFKDMVKALHKEGIEVILQFYFDRTVNVSLIKDCLEYWYFEYRVDGFFVMGENIPSDIILKDGFLADAKIYCNNIDRYALSQAEDIACKSVIDVNNGFSISTKRFLKSDEDSLGAFVSSTRYNPSDIYNLNYLSTYEGFTLFDTVAYEHKHNEANGENNSDGTSQNYSWNCGVEGKTQKKSVKALRLSQMKNAMCMLLLSNSMPMIFMGDEFMNTQNGNNNPYCQDNDTTWLNWTLNSYNSELLEFVKMLIKFRKESSVISMKEMTGRFAVNTGDFPSVSFHQESAWVSKTDNYLHHIGIMLNEDDETVYIAYNMHWENHTFGLPKPKKGYRWTYVFDTLEDMDKDISEKLIECQDEINVNKRSILVLKAVKGSLKEEK